MRVVEGGFVIDFVVLVMSLLKNAGLVGSGPICAVGC